MYMLTSTLKDEYVEEVYENVESILEMEDWNSVVEEGKDGEGVRRFTVWARNECKEGLVEFSQQCVNY